MSLSSHTFGLPFKSPARLVVRFLFQSRETQKARVEKRTAELTEAKELLRTSRLQECQLRKQLQEQARQIEELEQQLAESREQPIQLPDDPKLPHHSFGAKMISMCCNLSAAIGFRPAEKALSIFWEYLGLDTKRPTFETIRTWLQRVGVARLTLDNVEKKDGQLVWFVDHSCKVGTEKVLAILGMRVEDLPPPGTPLKHEHLIALLATAGESWKREDVAEQYEKLIEQVGFPLVINSDAAVELQDPASALKNGGQPVLVQTDPKHKLASIVKSVIGKEERFVEFSKKLGQTRAAIQQTELSHFTPPKQKTKARFMNLQSTIEWAETLLWHVSNPGTASRANVKTKRMNDKLGWLRGFRKDIQRWARCLSVVSVTLTFVNEQCLSVGSTGRLKKQLDKLQHCKTSRKVMNRTLEFMRASETNLKSLKIKGLRVPMSTEILESLFGRYKRLEGQHSQGGFTSLLASFAALLKPITPEEIKESFANVSTKNMKEWVKKQLGDTLQSKTNLVYAEYRATTQRNNKKPSKKHF